MNGFTDGPWTLDEDGDVVSGGTIVCVVVTTDKGNDDEAPANAKLIAAAPELLDMVRRCELWLGTLPEGRAMQLACQSLILKAEGRS